jgi:hypothetical protein
MVFSVIVRFDEVYPTKSTIRGVRKGFRVQARSWKIGGGQVDEGRRRRLNPAFLGALGVLGGE